MRNSIAGVGLCLFAVLLPSAVHPLEGAYRRRQLKQAPNNRAVLWRQPQNIAALDVFHGVGGKQNQPPKVVSFVKEDSGGSNPKFIVQDSLGRKWKVKL